MTEKELKLAALLHTYDRWNKLLVSKFEYESKGDKLHVKTFCNKHNIAYINGIFCSCCLMDFALNVEDEYCGSCHYCFISSAIEYSIVDKDKHSYCLKSLQTYKDYILDSKKHATECFILIGEVYNDIKDIITWVYNPGLAMDRLIWKSIDWNVKAPF